VADAEEATSRLEDESGEIESMFGIDVQPVGYSLRQARPLWRAHQTPFEHARREGWLLMGKPLHQLLG
jgi:hypothetical protein